MLKYSKIGRHTYPSILLCHRILYEERKSANDSHEYLNVDTHACTMCVRGDIEKKKKKMKQQY